MTATIPDEAAGKQRLAESLKKIRRAEGFPTKQRRVSLGREYSDWFRSIKRGVATESKKPSE
jgi:hypothetical protein